MSPGNYIFVDKVGGSMDAPVSEKRNWNKEGFFFSLQQIISSPIYTFQKYRLHNPPSGFVFLLFFFLVQKPRVIKTKQKKTKNTYIVCTEKKNLLIALRRMEQS